MNLKYLKKIITNYVLNYKKEKLLIVNYLIKKNKTVKLMN